MGVVLGRTRSSHVLAVAGLVCVDELCRFPAEPPSLLPSCCVAVSLSSGCGSPCLLPLSNAHLLNLSFGLQHFPHICLPSRSFPAISASVSWGSLDARCTLLVKYPNNQRCVPLHEISPSCMDNLPDVHPLPRVWIQGLNDEGARATGEVEELPTVTSFALHPLQFSRQLSRPWTHKSQTSTYAPSQADFHLPHPDKIGSPVDSSCLPSWVLQLTTFPLTHQLVHLDRILSSGGPCLLASFRHRCSHSHPLRIISVAHREADRAYESVGTTAAPWLSMPIDCRGATSEENPHKKAKTTGLA